MDQDGIEPSSPLQATVLQTAKLTTCSTDPIVLDGTAGLEPAMHKCSGFKAQRIANSPTSQLFGHPCQIRTDSATLQTSYATVKHQGEII